MNLRHNYLKRTQSALRACFDERLEDGVNQRPHLTQVTPYLDLDTGVEVFFRHSQFDQLEDDRFHLNQDEQS